MRVPGHRYGPVGLSLGHKDALAVCHPFCELLKLMTEIESNVQRYLVVAAATRMEFTS
jgi:hypothetical protein